MERIQAEPVTMESSEWSTPVIHPLPDAVSGTKQAVIDLNDREGGGSWEFLFASVPEIPAPGAGKQDFDPSCLPVEGWKKVAVPCELAMQGFDIENNREYYYRRRLSVPADFAGKRIFLRFDGVYSNARCWIDGHFVRSHTGGFTSWDCEITPFVRAGEEAALFVGVADLEGSASGNYNPDGGIKGDPSWASYYAHHNIGGILRDVSLFALPEMGLERLQTDTRFDRNFQDAVLSVRVQANAPACGNGEAAQLHMMLTDREGNSVAECSAQIPGGQAAELCLPVRAPRHWDAEHPYLYMLTLSLEKNGEVLEILKRKVGFRELHFGGRDGTAPNKLYVNGKEVKLRGTCRHDVSLRGGRSTTKEEDWAEIRAYREANINHIRTSHYPPSRHLLEACDELGMYVEEENGACFQGANGYDVHAGAEDFVTPFTEMVERDRNHPCVILWSLGNESGFERTPAYRTEYNYIKSVDQSRPVIFSYPQTVETFPLPYDICSRHYEKWDGSLGGPDMPVLHDEFAHIPCYDIEEQKRDPNVRNFWGAGLKKAWENIFRTDGALGADLWGGIDDIFLLPEGVGERWQTHSGGAACGYGEWGSVLDVYRRRKPEAWLTGKAYSPIRLQEDAVCVLGTLLSVPVSNWFDHTRLDEITLRYRLDNGEEKTASLPPIEPHADGRLLLEDDWEQAKEAELIFLQGDRRIDAFRLTLPASGKMTQEKAAASLPPVIHEKERELVVECPAPGLILRFDKREARLIDASCHGQLLLSGGADLHAGGIKLPAWRTSRRVYAAMENGRAVIGLQGHYGEQVEMLLLFRIAGDGQINIEYQLRNHRLPENLYELGISFPLAQDVDRISWKRKGLYSWYPREEIGRDRGTAFRFSERAQQAGYGAVPTWDWKEDLYDVFLDAPEEAKNGKNAATRDFRAMRENICRYTAAFTSGPAAVTVEADGDAAARIALDGETVKLIVNSQWCYPDLGWGNDTGRPVRPGGPGSTGYVRLRLGVNAETE